MRTEAQTVAFIVAPIARKEAARLAAIRSVNPHDPVGAVMRIMISLEAARWDTIAKIAEAIAKGAPDD